MNHLTLSSVAGWPETKWRKWTHSLTDLQRRDLKWHWEFLVHSQAQLPPVGDWQTWLFLGGRGSGKTWTGAQWVRRKKETVGRIALLAPTAADVRDVMVEGDSGILAVAPNHDRPKYEPQLPANP